MSKRNAFELLMKGTAEAVKKSINKSKQLSTKPPPPPPIPESFTPKPEIKQITLDDKSSKTTPKTEIAKYSKGITYDFLLRFDGGSRGNPGHSGAGSVIYHQGSEMWNRSMYLGDDRTNNYAEYYGLIVGLIGAKHLKIKNLRVEGDSKLIINQVTGKFKVNSALLKPLYQKVKTQLEAFDNVEFNHIYRDKNKRADELANIAMDKKCNDK